MQLNIGDVVKLRDGRYVSVTDAVDQTAAEVVMHPDDLCIGNVLQDINSYRTVFPASEVVAVVG